jgi:anaerobic magnesium-protoporphyrin IX monomethyl ester cyclase
MKISFISLGLSTDAIGPRILSSLLKQNGFHTQLLFLPTVEDLKRRSTQKIYEYSDQVLDKVAHLCKDSDLIGISLMTHHYSIALNLTHRINQRLSTPIIWGGIHPTVSPEQCLETAALVCVGEAEASLVDLARHLQTGQDISAVPGIWLKENGRIVKNGVGPLASDLDRLPFPDYSFEDHHLLIEGELQPMTKDNWHQHLIHFFPPFNRHRPENPAYQVLSARGCPFTCSFCGETPLLEETYGRRYFRRRSIDNLMRELVWAKETFPFIGEICFCDDTFASRSFTDIQNFAQQYKELINLPFYILVSPANVDKMRFDLLVDAGLTNVGMGIQSGSKRTIDLYNRQQPGNIEQSLKAAHILNSYKDRLMPYYDFILENPYETREDLLDTVRLLIKLPRPYQVRTYALSFFPGTQLYKKACADGIFHADMYDKTFGQRTLGGYLNFIIDLTKYEAFRPALSVLTTRYVVSVFCRPWGDKLFKGILKLLKWVAMKTRIHEKGLS